MSNWREEREKEANEAIDSGFLRFVLIVVILFFIIIAMEAGPVLLDAIINGKLPSWMK